MSDVASEPCGPTHSGLSLDIASLIHDQARLPLDLERTEYSSSELVARRVQNWVEPLLYRVVYLSPQLWSRRWEVDAPHQQDIPTFTPEILLRVIATKPTQFLANAVRHLFVDGASRMDHDEVAAIIAACSGVKDLFVQFVPSDLNCAIPDLQRLATAVAPLFQPSTVDFAHPLFRNITHLEVLDRPWAAFGGLDLIPHLTHIAFNGIPSDLALHTLLCADARLRCIIFITSMLHKMRQESPLLADSRFLCLLQNSNYRADWLRGAYWGENHWVLADKFILARRAGKVDRSLYHISDSDHY
ncbi:hypothetical protein B0H13DRAFT_2388860 [Mycena leptocephala]|nr:hypothetical protein B0H13DRAFT_2388860 [Mycena leptocephala]